jgi:hypothetical protein
MDSLRRLVRGTHQDSLYQNIADYSTAAALGIGGQQVANWVTGGADPNPLVSGALMTPALTYGLRQGRARAFAGTPQGGSVNRVLADEMLSNPYSQAALYGSGASLVGGIGTNALNTITGGDDIDPNNAAMALGLLGGVAPIAMSMMNPSTTRLIGNYAKPSVNVAGNMGANSTGKYRADNYDRYHGVPKGWGRDTSSSANQQPYKNNGNYYAPTSASTQTVDVPSQPVTRPSVMGALPYQRGGDLAVRTPRDTKMYGSSRIVVPPLPLQVLQSAIGSPKYSSNEYGPHRDVDDVFPIETALRQSYTNVPRDVRPYIQ